MSNPNVTVIKQEEIADRSATVYYSTTGVAELKYVCYEISDGNRRLYIEETYVLEHYEGAMKTSADVPIGVEIWGADGSVSYFYSCSAFGERPSVEWLSQFGIREHIETEVA